MGQTAKEELQEFRAEREAVGVEEDKGSAALSEPFRVKWFGKYPQFDTRPRSSLFRCFNRLDDYLEAKAKEEEAGK